MVGLDVWGAMGRVDAGRTEQHIAYSAHLGGAAMALAYFRYRWNFGQLLHSASVWLKRRARPSLRSSPGMNPMRPSADEEVDRILAKIHREGENSLTRKERRILKPPAASINAAAGRSKSTHHAPRDVFASRGA